ncbi:MAG: glycerate kinase [Flavisolibacter sp.]
MDKFKGSLNSFEAVHAVAEGLQKASSNFKTIKLPLADGGDGLLEVISFYTEAARQTTPVLDPLFRSIDSWWLLSSSKKIAYVEMAKASGLGLVEKKMQNPLYTTSYGTGQLIEDAVKKDAKTIIIGVGGSATCDGGMGMAAALGYQFLDKKEIPLQPIGKNLIQIDRISSIQKQDLGQIKFQVACDVKSYLTGPQGASYSYGPQKGATTIETEYLEKGMLHYARIVKRDLGVNLLSIQGGGAAGGLAAGCVCFLKAKLISGIETVMKISKAKKYFQKADLIITGEGKIDSQSLQGKVVAGVTALSRQCNKEVYAICGTRELTPRQVSSLGLKKVISLVDKSIPHEVSMANAFALLKEASLQLGKDILKNL